MPGARCPVPCFWVPAESGIRMGEGEGATVLLAELSLQLWGSRWEPRRDGGCQLSCCHWRGQEVPAPQQVTKGLKCLFPGVQCVEVYVQVVCTRCVCVCTCVRVHVCAHMCMYCVCMYTSIHKHAPARIPQLTSPGEQSPARRESEVPQSPVQTHHQLGGGGRQRGERAQEWDSWGRGL